MRRRERERERGEGGRKCRKGEMHMYCTITESPDLILVSMLYTHDGLKGSPHTTSFLPFFLRPPLPVLVSKRNRKKYRRRRRRRTRYMKMLQENLTNTAKTSKLNTNFCQPVLLVKHNSDFSNI